MHDLTQSQRARVAVQSFKTIAHALSLRGYYRPSEKMGQSMAECLLTLSPEIYGSMSDPRIVELKGLEYVIDRLPRGIEAVTRIILTEEEQLGGNDFERIVPLKRRRDCYLISDTEVCFVITRGLSEIYDILTHITFLCIEARKIRKRMTDEIGDTTIEWASLEKTVQDAHDLEGKKLDQAIWNLSIILGRSYQETRECWAYLEKNRKERRSNNSLFTIIHRLGRRLLEEEKARENALVVYFTPALMNVIAHHRHGEQWANDIKTTLKTLSLDRRPLHIVSANMHSVLNLIYGYDALTPHEWGSDDDLYAMIHKMRDQRNSILEFARNHGMTELPDASGTHIDCQVIDTARLPSLSFHPDLNVAPERFVGDSPVILVMDYAFGAQAFEVMENLLMPFGEGEHAIPMPVESVSIMGKAGILPGAKGDIMLATAHVLEGSSDNYIFNNELTPADFDSDIPVHAGPMITVVGTSLQNKAMLKKFQEGWNTVGLEMEGGHYQRAISAAIIKGHISGDVKLRYAYYASDNPLTSGETLAAGEMGPEGVKPTYMVTKVILEKILGPSGTENHESEAGK